MTVDELEKVIINANLTQKHKKVFLAVLETMKTLVPEVPE